MHIETKQIKAKDIGCDVFVFNPQKNVFFFVDNVDVGEKETTLIFEPTANPDTWIYKKIANEKELEVVSNYKINPTDF